MTESSEDLLKRIDALEKRVAFLEKERIAGIEARVAAHNAESDRWRQNREFTLFGVEQFGRLLP